MSGYARRWRALLTVSVAAELAKIVQEGDPARFEDFRFRVNNKGIGRPAHQVDSPANSYGSSSAVQNPMPRIPVSTLSRLPTSGKCTFNVKQSSFAKIDNVHPDFKPSPFYEIVDTILPISDLPGTMLVPLNHMSSEAPLRD